MVPGQPLTLHEPLSSQKAQESTEESAQSKLRRRSRNRRIRRGSSSDHTSTSAEPARGSRWRWPWTGGTGSPRHWRRHQCARVDGHFDQRDVGKRRTDGSIQLIRSGVDQEGAGLREECLPGQRRILMHQHAARTGGVVVVAVLREVERARVFAIESGAERGPIELEGEQIRISHVAGVRRNSGGIRAGCAVCTHDLEAADRHLGASRGRESAGCVVRGVDASGAADVLAAGSE